MVVLLASTVNVLRDPTKPPGDRTPKSSPILNTPAPYANLRLVGEWRSLVAHLHGVQGVAGSNPVTPTSYALAIGMIVQVVV